MRESPFAVFAVAVRHDRDAERHRAQVRSAAQPVDWRFRIAVFELAVGGTHAADRLEHARHALGWPRCFPGALAPQELLPAGTESVADVVLVRLGDHADAHPAVRIDGERADAAAALIDRVGDRPPFNRAADLL